MESSALWWIVAVISSLIGGIALVGVLVSRRVWEPLAAFVVVASGVVAAYAVATLGRTYERMDAVFYAFAFELATLGGGYALASTLLHKLVRPLRTPSVSPMPDRADAAIAVIVACCTEPPSYDPRATAGMLQSLTDEGLLDLSIGGLPLLFFAHKARYRGLNDRSPSRDELITIADKLGSQLAEQRMSVSWATCSGEVRLAERVAAEARMGRQRIVVAELAVATSIHMEAAWDEVASLDLAGVDVVQTDRVVDSDAIPQAIIERVLSSTAEAATGGAVLVGHGQPEERARSRPSFEEDETMFLSRLRVLLIEAGFKEDHVRIAWAEWAEPGVTTQVRHLAALGCDKIAVVPAVFPLDTLSTRIDLHVAAEQAHLDRSIAVHVLPAWGPDPVVIGELERVVRMAAEEPAPS